MFTIKNDENFPFSIFSSPSFSIATQNIILENLGIREKLFSDVVLDGKTFLGFSGRWIDILFDIYKIENSRFNMELKMKKIV